MSCDKGSCKYYITATVSEIKQIRCFYTNDAEKDIIINDDEFQLISVKTTNPPYLTYVAPYSPN